MITVHVVGSPETAFYVNAFVLEGSRSVVAVDTHFLHSSTAVLGERIREIGKPLAAVLITHPHPDHFNGIGALAGGGAVPVFATETTRRVIAETAEGKRQAWKPTYGDDYPDAVPLPDRVVRSGEALSFDDIQVVLHELGPAEDASP